MLQLIQLFLRNERITVRAVEAHHISPAAIGGNVPNGTQIDDVAAVAAEEEAFIQTGFGLVERIGNGASATV